MRKKSLLNAFHIKISSCIHQINSHAKYIVVFDQWNQNYYKKINSFEFEIFATLNDRDIDFAKFEIVKIVKIFEIFSQFFNSFCVFFVCFFVLFSLLLRCFESKWVDSTFFKDIRRHIEWNSTLLKVLRKQLSVFGD